MCPISKKSENNENYKEGNAMLTNREFERIVEFIKRKSGIDLNEKKVLV